MQEHQLPDRALLSDRRARDLKTPPFEVRLRKHVFEGKAAKKCAIEGGKKKILRNRKNFWNSYVPICFKMLKLIGLIVLKHSLQAERRKIMLKLPIGISVCLVFSLNRPLFFENIDLISDIRTQNSIE